MSGTGITSDLTDRHPIAAMVGFVVVADLACALLKATVVASLSESYPVTLALFVVAVVMLRWVLGMRAVAALGVTLVLLTPLFLWPVPQLSSFSASSSFRCDGFDNTLSRAVTVLAFPLDPGHIGLWGLGVGALAWLLVQRAPWPTVAAVARWLAVGVAVAAQIALVRAASRIESEVYLASRPAVATLFPTSDPGVPASPGTAEIEYPAVPIGPFSVKRRCWHAGTSDCVVYLDDFTGFAVGCLRSSSPVVLRRDEMLDVWFVDDGLHRYAFRRDVALHEKFVWREITRADLLSFTRPPIGWLLSPTLGILIAVGAGVLRRRGPAGAARNQAEAPDTARFRALAWNVCGLAAVVLSLLVVSPWLRVALGGR